jgi:hypothetical protein
MSVTDQELMDIGNFIQNSLSSFVKNEPLTDPPVKLNWRKLQGIVRGRNLGPLFSFCHGNSALPPPVIQDWQQEKTRTSLQNLARLKVATDITVLAERAGIKIVAMRGIVLAHSLYRDPAMRPMHDIDFIIRPQDKEKFLAAMHDAGYEPTDLFRSQYVFKIRNVLIEVHWYLLSNKRYREKIDSELLVSTAIKQETTGGFYYRLHDTWEIIGLVIHAFTHHNLSQIYSLIDIGLYMQNKEVDWQEIADFSNKTGITRMMRLTFGFVNHYFGLIQDDNVLRPFPAESDKTERFYRYYMEQTILKMTLSTHIGIKRSQFYVAESSANKFREFLRLFSAKELRFLLDQLKMIFKGKQQKLQA